MTKGGQNIERVQYVQYVSFIHNVLMIMRSVLMLRSKIFTTGGFASNYNNRLLLCFASCCECIVKVSVPSYRIHLKMVSQDRNI
jgi:hypothetical protein